jgi:hypothetical protein
MATTGNDWQRLAGFVRARREEDLGLTQEEIAAAGGPSTATQRLIEGARHDSYRPASLRSLERALQWEPGSVRAILAGGDPVPGPEDPTMPGVIPVDPAPAGTAVPAGAVPDPLTRIGQALAAAFTAIEKEVWDEIDAARGRGASEAAIFADPDEQHMWAMPLTSEEQRAANIAALRAFRRDRPPLGNSGTPPVGLAG